MLLNLLYKIISIIVIPILIVSCGGETRKLTTEEIIYSPKDQARRDKMDAGGKFLSDLFSGKNSEDNVIGGVSVSSKSPLWRASLETLSSFPLANIDSRSGIIITDWYVSEKKPSERFKITVLLLAPEIRSDSIKVSVHRQIIKKNRWINKNIDIEKLQAIERKIIQRAIELNL